MDAPPTPSPSPDRPPRFGEPGFVDRRRRPTPMVSRFTFLGGRRRGASGRVGVEDYVDLYDPRTVALVLVFFALTIFDAIATVYYIDHVHGAEWNPIADWMLRQGRVFFVLAKGIPTGLMLLFVMIHKNFRYGRLAMYLGFAFYFVLGIYHVSLQVMACLYEHRLLDVD